MFLNVLSSKIPCKRSCFLLDGSSLIRVGKKDNLLGLFASTSPNMVTESLGMQGETEDMERQGAAMHLMLQPAAVGWRW